MAIKLFTNSFPMSRVVPAVTVGAVLKLNYRFAHSSQVNEAELSSYELANRILKSLSHHNKNELPPEARRNVHKLLKETLSLVQESEKSSHNEKSMDTVTSSQKGKGARKKMTYADFKKSIVVGFNEYKSKPHVLRACNQDESALIQAYEDYCQLSYNEYVASTGRKSLTPLDIF